MVLIQNNDSYDTYSWWYSYPKYIRGCPAGMVLIEADYTGTDENMPGLTSSQTGSLSPKAAELCGRLIWFPPNMDCRHMGWGETN